MYRQHVLCDGPSLMSFFLELEADNEKLKEEGKEPLTACLLLTGPIGNPWSMLGIYDILRQNAAQKPVLRIMSNLYVHNLIFALAVGKENTYVTKSTIVFPFELEGFDYTTLTDMEITTAANTRLIERIFNILHEGYGWEGEKMVSFNLEKDFLSYAELSAMGYKPFPGNPEGVDDEEVIDEDEANDDDIDVPQPE